MLLHFSHYYSAQTWVLNWAPKSNLNRTRKTVASRNCNPQIIPPSVKNGTSSVLQTAWISQVWITHFQRKSHFRFFVINFINIRKFLHYQCQSHFSFCNVSVPRRDLTCNKNIRAGQFSLTWPLNLSESFQKQAQIQFFSEKWEISYQGGKLIWKLLLYLEWTKWDHQVLYMTKVWKYFVSLSAKLPVWK